MISFQVGDPVVCVDDAPSFGWLDVPGYLDALSELHTGHVYRVARVDLISFPIGDEVWLSLEGVSDGPPDPDNPELPVSWWSNRFRKVLKADERFTEQMRALKPQRVAA